MYECELGTLDCKLLECRGQFTVHKVLRKLLGSTAIKTGLIPFPTLSKLGVDRLSKQPIIMADIWEHYGWYSRIFKRIGIGQKLTDITNILPPAAATIFLGLTMSSVRVEKARKVCSALTAGPVCGGTRMQRHYVCCAACLHALGMQTFWVWLSFDFFYPDWAKATASHASDSACHRTAEMDQRGHASRSR